MTDVKIQSAIVPNPSGFPKWVQIAAGSPITINSSGDVREVQFVAMSPNEIFGECVMAVFNDMTTYLVPVKHCRAIMIDGTDIVKAGYADDEDGPDAPGQGEEPPSRWKS